VGSIHSTIRLTGLLARVTIAESVPEVQRLTEHNCHLALPGPHLWNFVSHTEHNRQTYIGFLGSHAVARTYLVSEASMNLFKTCRFLSFGIFLASATLRAQSPIPRPLGSLDREIAVPEKAGTLGRGDAAALAYIRASQQTQTPWAGMRGSGSLTFGDDTATRNDATLVVDPNFDSLLDVHRADGTWCRLHRNDRVTIRNGDGTIQLQPFESAHSGIAAFTLPRDSGLLDGKASLIDRGLVKIDGISMRFITLHTALHAKNAAASAPGIVTTDLYFDPAKHLLMKSATSVRLPHEGNTDYLRVISFDDYREIDGMLLPYRFTQTLNGQLQWTLQLSTVQLNAVLDPADCNF